MPLPRRSSSHMPEQQMINSLTDAPKPLSALRDTQIAAGFGVSTGKRPDDQPRGPFQPPDLRECQHRRSLRQHQAHPTLTAVEQHESWKRSRKTMVILSASENPKARQQLKSTLSPTQEKGDGKRRKSHTVRPSTLLDCSPSSAGGTPVYNGTGPVTTAHYFASLGLPNPRLPPPDHDNTGLWAAVMAKSKTLRPPRTASTNPKVSDSHGGRGTLGYGDMLFKIGIELPGPSDNPQFMETTDPRTYPGFETQLKVSKHATSLSASKTGWTTDWTPTTKPSEDALKRKLERAHQFQHHDAAELHQKIFSFPIVRLSPGERAKGLSASKKTPQTVPVQSELRGWCDVVFGLTDRCMSNALRKGTADIPCYHRPSGICSIFLLVELKRTMDDQKAAEHQFAIAAYQTLLNRARMARSDRTSLLDSGDSSGHLRHYGYVICRQAVHIWEMSVERYQEERSSDETFFDNRFLRFPCKKLRELDLLDAEDVQDFSK